VHSKKIGTVLSVGLIHLFFVIMSRAVPLNHMPYGSTYFLMSEAFRRNAKPEAQAFKHLWLVGFAAAPQMMN
jgi:hypothetical protein